MEIKHLLNDDRAVSPVIGVILMVAITVILAAVIGTFVLGLGSGLNSAPTAQLDFSYDPPTGTETSGTVTVTHTGGNSLTASEINISSSGSGTAAASDWGDADGTITAGESVEISAVADDKISVVWTSEDGSSSSVLDEFTVQ